MSKYFSEDNVTREVTFSQMLGLLWPFMRARRRALAGILILVGTFVAVSRGLPFVFGYSIDKGIRAHNLDVVMWCAGLYLGLEALKCLLQFSQNYFMQRIANRVLFDVREKLIRHLQSLPLGYFDRNPLGRIVTRVTNDVLSLGELFTQGFTAFFVNSIELISILLSLCILSLPLAALTLLVAPPMLWIVLKISRKLRYHFKESKKKLAIINAYTAESVAGMKVLQIFNREKQSKLRFEELSDDFRLEQLKTVRLFATLWPVLEFFNVGTVTATLLFGALFHDRFGMTIGQLSAFVLLVQSFFRPLRVILERYNTLQNSLASADRVFHLLEEAVDPAHKGRTSERPLRGQVQMENLWFRYGPELPWVLKDINLQIRPGERLAIVGRTGSGKSSLISLLQRLYEFEKGRVLLDAEDIKTFDGRSLRRRIGVVQQDNFIFRGTVASNINLGNSEIPESIVREAAIRAHCLELGLDSHVDERGHNLSVGERQLIAFARILAFNPDILILDEATSNIDSLSESLIQKATDEVTKGRTSIIIAHRLSTIVNSDRIIVLKDGEIIEQGDFTQLMNLKGVFYQMYQTQSQATARGESIAVPGN